MKVTLAESDDEIRACFPVMRHLRDLEDAEAFLRRVRSQERAGYHLAAVTGDDGALAVAGFRLNENLAWGRHLYVDDLVTLPESRSSGCGKALLDWLVAFARAQGAQQLHLDSGLPRVDAHRFYRREGLEVSSFHFNRRL